MKFCPFCGSPAAAWPEYASDYVRGYPLCEHHMSRILEKATVRLYDTVQAKISQRQKLIRGQVINLLSQIEDESEEDPVFENRTESRYGMNLCEITLSFVDKIKGSIPEAEDEGPPSDEYIDETETDRLVSARIMGFARDVDKGNPIKRCAAHRSGKPDGRCINRAEHGSTLCGVCMKKTTVQSVTYGPDKMNQVMEALRS